MALLEILIAIGILGIIAAGVATLASRTFEEQNVNDINDSVVDLSVSLKDAYRRSGGYYLSGSSDETLDTLIDTSAISIDSVRNPVTGAYYDFFPTKKDGAGATANNDAFVLTIDGLSDSLCRKLVTGSMFQDATYLEIAAGGSTTATTSFNVAPSVTVVKTLQGYMSGPVTPPGGGAPTGSTLDMDNPLTYDLLCTNGSNAILFGSY
ncbi:hypothetical protein HQQ94_06545 [Shewanella sp. VB17]|nr:hypothetical protein [Shewanella sp. VB17]